MKNTNAINFLLFSYFGFTLEDCKEKWDLDWNDFKEVEKSVLWKIINKAYKDATQQGAYNALVDGDGRSEELKFEGAKELQKGILKLLDNEKNYDKEHDDICKKLIGVYKNIKVKTRNETDKSAFTYGNAQKWLNMTMKYLYVVNQICEEYLGKKDYSNEEYKEHFFVRIQKIKDVENKLHVPVDSYIIQAAWKEETVKLPLRQDRKGQRGKEYKNPSDYVKPWSQWDNKQDHTVPKGEYSAFQTTLKTIIGPQSSRIDWECKKWIETAKDRRNMELEKKYKPKREGNSHE